jgi:hypothetical protein
MNRRSLIAALALTLTAGRAFADGPGVGGAQFLSIEQGARALGMGGAFSAVADDANGLWWNPAGIARSEFSEVTLTHTAYLDSVATEYVGYVRPVPQARGVLGASLTYLNVPGVEGTDATGAPTGNLKTNGIAGALSYGMTLSPNLTAGATAKYVSQTLGPTSGSGFAADIGAQYRAADYGAAVVVQNLGPSFKVGGSSDPLPRDIRGGLFFKPRSQFLVSFDEEKPYNADAVAHVGGEYLIAQGIRLRAGYQQTPNAPGAGLTFGIGLAGQVGGKAAGGGEKGAMGDIDVARPFWERMMSSTAQDFKAAVDNGGYIIGLDYAYVAGGTNLNDVQRVTLNVRF